MSGHAMERHEQVQAMVDAAPRRADRLSCLLAAHIWMATPGIDPKPRARYVYGLARLVAGHVWRQQSKVAA